jgi:DNA-binding transcriptional regulator YbjK
MRNPGIRGFDFPYYVTLHTGYLLDLDEDGFIHYGNEMLNGVAAFWDGLDEQRRELAAVH